MIPAYLNDLHLDQVLATYTTNVDAYLQQSNSNEHIVDSETLKISGFVSPTFGQPEELALKYFEVQNANSRDFSLLQIDNGAISAAAPTKRCDCAVITDKEFSFIEFKANALSSKTKTIKANYKSAMKQLRITIDIFRSGIAASGASLNALRNVEAFVCFRRGYPRVTTSEMTYRTNFAAQAHVPLSFDPIKRL